MLTDELKPCPFCGMQPEDPDVGDYFVECPRCGVQGPVGNEDGRPIAKAEWNRRAVGAEVMAEVCSAQNSEYAPQDCLSLTDATQVRMEAQEPVASANAAAKMRFFRDMTSPERRKVFEVFGIESAVLNEVRSLSDETRLFKHLFAARQPPAPCPKCAEWMAADHKLSDAYLRIRQKLGALDTPHGPTADQVYECTEAALDALQAKVAEQSAEIERLKSERDEYNSAWQHAGEEYRKLRDSLLSLAGAFK